LEKAAFREFRDKRQAKRSVGWAGQDPESSDRQWRFGVCVSARRTWLLGGSIIAHELFHGVQDVKSGGRLFCPPAPLRWWQEVLVEAEALFFGGPLIGVPFLALLLGCLAASVWMLWVLIEVLALLL
jgi:hypothetical protein